MFPLLLLLLSEAPSFPTTTSRFYRETKEIHLQSSFTIKIFPSRDNTFGSVVLTPKSTFTVVNLNDLDFVILAFTIQVAAVKPI